MTDPAVIKLGGSYAGSAERDDWLDAIEDCAGQVILVPGGGPFADAVRTAQKAMGYHDRAAHHMALLAMEQYGCALASLRSRFMLANSVEAIRGVLVEGGVPVWAPALMVAWLAGILGVSRLLLVKRIAGSQACLSAADLAAKGIVDPLFPRFLGASRAEAYIAGPADHAAAAAAIRRAGLPGSRIALP